MKFDIKNLEEFFRKLYGSDPIELETQFNRYQALITRQLEYFSEDDIHLFSSPGRTELGGNHTDHNRGRVLAASINLDSIAAVTKNDSGKITLFSEGYDKPFEVNLNSLGIVENEKGTTRALIRGIASGLVNSGYKIGGFSGCMASNVLPGSGLSSSASVEILIGSIFNYFFNEGKISPETLARIGQYAENEYFGKPCGLMDQLACAVGGIISIDFKDALHPLVEKISIDFDSHQYSLLVVDSGGNHADLTDDYAAVPQEMKAVAKAMGAETLRELSMGSFLEKIADLRKQAGDRAVLRAFHYLQENERVEAQVKALKSGDFRKFLRLVNESGNSSFKWLQNIHSGKNPTKQGLTLALALSEKYISEIGQGACRVHGGGFAGTIQVFLPSEAVKEYISRMESVFGKGSVTRLTIRRQGCVVR